MSTLKIAENLMALPDRSRVWIYQTDKSLSDDEVSYMAEKTESFIQEWAAHGSKLMAGYGIFYHRFFVLAVDEQVAAASGCSIDSSVHFVQDLGKKLDVDFFDRIHVAYKENDEVKTMPMGDFEEKVSQGTFDENTIVFNNLVPTLHDFKEKWEGPLQFSWHSKFLE